MKLTAAIEYARGEIVRADYIENTNDMLAERNRWQSHLTMLLERQKRRAAEVGELVG